MMCIRKDVLEAGGMSISKINTTDDLYEAFKTMKSQTSGAVWGTRSGSSLSGLNRMAQFFGTNVNDVVFFDTTTKKYVSPYDSTHVARTKAAVEFFTRLQEEGILHPDWPVMSDGQWDTNCKNGEVLAFADNGQTMDGYNYVLQQNDPKSEWAAVGKITYNGDFYPWPAGLSWHSYNGHMISADTNQIEPIMKIFDFMYDPDNHDIFVYGDEGVTYEKRSNGRKVYLFMEDSEDWQKIGFNTYGLNTTNFIKVWEKPEFFGYHMKETEAGGAFEQGYDVYANDIYTVKLVPTNFNQEQNDRLEVLRTPAVTYVRENISNFILGRKPMNEWNAFVQGLDDYSADEIVKIYNDAMIMVK